MGINDVANLNLIKYVDKNYADVGDVLNYTVGIFNTGAAVASNIVFFESIPSSTTFINNSFKLNGITQSGASPITPNQGIIGTIFSGGASTVTFSVHVNTIPVNNKIENYGEVMFSSVQDNPNSTALYGSAISNTTTTTVRHADVILIKSASALGAKIGDVITYTVLITNTGNIAIQNMMFIDNLCSSVSFVENSAKINGIAQQGVTPCEVSGGMNIATMNPSETITVSFDVLVIAIPKGNIIENSALARFNYLIDLDGITSTPIERYSNTVSVSIDEVIIDYDYEKSFTSSVDKSFADVNEILTYTLVIHNSGNVESTNVVVTDTIPKGTTFIPNSVWINGVLQNRANPTPGLGISVGTIPAGGSATINFKVEVVTIPSSESIINSATVGFRYISNTSCPSKTFGFGNSNIISTSVRNGDLSLEKSVDRSCANIGDIITYTVAITNKGNVIVENIEVKDIIPYGTTFIENSVNVSCNNISGIYIQNGINIPCLSPNKTIIITFKVRVDNVPMDREIKNVVDLTYEFYKDDRGTIVKRTLKSNEVIVLVNSVDFQDGNFSGGASTNYAAVGDLVGYSFDIENGGNIRAIDVVFIDTLPNYLTLVENTITINGILIEGISLENGIPIGTIQAGESINVSFDTKVNSIPSNGIITNSAYLDYRYNMDPCKQFNYGSVESNPIFVRSNSTNIILVKTVTPQGIRVGGEVLYTIKVYNLGNIVATDVVVRDVLNQLLEFVEESLRVDDNKIVGNIINGVNIGKINANEAKEVTFKAKVLGYPSNRIISNTSSCVYRFIVDPTKIARKGMEISNTCNLEVGIVNVLVDKTSDVLEAKIESRVNFTVNIKNIGTVRVNDFVFKDILASNLEFNNNSFTLNGKSIKSVNLKSGVMIGSLNVGQSMRITYFAIVKNAPCNCKAENAAFGEFDYKINEVSSVEKYKTNIAKLEIKVPSSTFKQIAVNQSFKIPKDKMAMKEIEAVKVKVDILNYYIGKSGNEAEASTGDKITINGFLINEVEYTAASDSNGVYLAKFRKPFTSYVLLPKNHDRLRNIDIKTLVEDVSYKIAEPTEVIINVVFMIDVRLL